MMMLLLLVSKILYLFEQNTHVSVQYRVTKIVFIRVCKTCVLIFWILNLEPENSYFGLCTIFQNKCEQVNSCTMRETWDYSLIWSKEFSICVLLDLFIYLKQSRYFVNGNSRKCFDILFVNPNLVCIESGRTITKNCWFPRNV